MYGGLLNADLFMKTNMVESTILGFKLLGLQCIWVYWKIFRYYFRDIKHSTRSYWMKMSLEIIIIASNYYCYCLSSILISVCDFFHRISKALKSLTGQQNMFLCWILNFEKFYYKQKLISWKDIWTVEIVTNVEELYDCGC